MHSRYIAPFHPRSSQPDTNLPPKWSVPSAYNIIFCYSLSSVRSSSSLIFRQISLPNPPLDGRSLRNSGNPLQEVGERLHLFLGNAHVSIPLNPWPCSNIGDRVFPLAIAGEIVPWFSRKFSRKLNFKHAVHAEGFVTEAFNSICFGTIVLASLNTVVRIREGIDVHGIFSFENLTK